MNYLTRTIAHNRLFNRLFIIDPGLQGLYRVIRTLLTVITNILVTFFVFQLIGQKNITQAPLLAAVLGMMPTFAINDSIIKERKKTLLIAGIAAAVTVSLGTLLLPLEPVKYIGLLLIVFFAFYLRKYGPRYIPIGMIAFIGYYFTFFIPIPLQSLPYILLAVVIAIAISYLYMFVLMPQRNQMNLQNLLHSWDIQAARIMKILLEEHDKEQLRKKIKQEVNFLTQISTTLEEQLTYDEIEVYGKKFQQQTLRVYFFDSTLAVLTLTRILTRCKFLQLTRKENEYLYKILVLLRKAFLAHQWTIRQKRWAEVLDLLNNPPTLMGEDLRKYLQNISSQVEWLLFDATEIMKGKRQYGENEDIVPRKLPSGTFIQTTTTQGIQAVVAVAVSIIVGFIFTLTKPYWVIITAFVVLANSGTIGRAYNRALLRSVGTILGAAVGFGLAIILGKLLLLKIVFIFLSIFFAFYFFQINYALMSFGITIMLALLYDIMLGGASPGILIARVIDTFIGSIIGLAASFIVFPKREDTEFKEKVIAYLEQLSILLDYYTKQTQSNSKKKVTVKDLFVLSKNIQELRALSEIMRKVPGYASAKYETIVTIFQSLNFHIAHLFHVKARKDVKNENLPVSAVQTILHNLQIIQEHIQSPQNKSKLELINESKEQREIKQNYSQITKLEHINDIIIKLAEAYNLNLEK